MKASELRIGNWVVREYGMVQKQTVKSRVEIEDLFEAHLYKPIPLTEEWLVKFGLDNCGYENLFWVKDSGKNRFEISAYDGSFGIRINDMIDVNLEYVHQLQNLYFALTGEELTIK